MALLIRGSPPTRRRLWELFGINAAVAVMMSKLVIMMRSGGAVTYYMRKIIDGRHAIPIDGQVSRIQIVFRIPDRPPTMVCHVRKMRSELWSLMRNQRPDGGHLSGSAELSLSF